MNHHIFPPNLPKTHICPPPRSGIRLNFEPLAENFPQIEYTSYEVKTVIADNFDPLANNFNHLADNYDHIADNSNHPTDNFPQ